jgi:hypothetical protein
VRPLLLRPVVPRLAALLLKRRRKRKRKRVGHSLDNQQC